MVVGRKRQRQSIDLDDRQTALIERWKVETGYAKTELVRLFIDHMENNPELRGQLVEADRRSRLDRMR